MGFSKTTSKLEGFRIQTTGEMIFLDDRMDIQQTPLGHLEANHSKNKTKQNPAAHPWGGGNTSLPFDNFQMQFPFSLMDKEQNAGGNFSAVLL